MKHDVSDLERINGDIFGLIVQTSDLMAAGCSFVIPLPFLLTQSATGGGQWLSANVTVPQLSYFGSLQAALADFDGDANNTVCSFHCRYHVRCGHSCN